MVVEGMAGRCWLTKQDYLTRCGQIVDEVLAGRCWLTRQDYLTRCGQIVFHQSIHFTSTCEK